MAIFTPSNIIFFNVAFFLFLSPFSLAQVNQNIGFSIDLIPVDSVVSTRHNSSATQWDHVNNAILRSKNRADGLRFTSLIANLHRNIIPDGDFLMRLSIGTPPFVITGLADTGGNLSWTQCKPCPGCYQQRPPLFDPDKSSTYRKLHSDTRLCEYIGGRDTHFKNDSCGYTLSYSDHSYSNGVISLDTFTLNSGSGVSVSISNIFFGCGTRNRGHFNRESSGVIGLGGGPGSLITQMKDMIGGIFSYCLVPQTKTNSRPSKMHFGCQASVSHRTCTFFHRTWTASTQLHIYRDTFYAARFHGLSVGDPKLATTKFLPFVNDGIIIESGTILTHLPRNFYNSFELEIRHRMEQYGVAADPNGKLNVCYRSKGDHIKAPVVTLHFFGADLKLIPRNIFVKVASDVHCLGFVPHDDVTTILGNLAQRNFLVGFDLNRKTVSFTSTDCSKL